MRWKKELILIWFFFDTDNVLDWIFKSSYFLKCFDEDALSPCCMTKACFYAKNWITVLLDTWGSTSSSSSYSSPSLSSVGGCADSAMYVSDIVSAVYSPSSTLMYSGMLIVCIGSVRVVNWPIKSLTSFVSGGGVTSSEVDKVAESCSLSFIKPVCLKHFWTVVWLTSPMITRLQSGHHVGWKEENCYGSQIREFRVSAAVV